MRLGNSEWGKDGMAKCKKGIVDMVRSERENSKVCVSSRKLAIAYTRLFPIPS